MARHVISKQLGRGKDGLTQRALEDQPALGAQLGVRCLPVYVEAIQIYEGHRARLAFVQSTAVRVHYVASQFSCSEGKQGKQAVSP